MHSSKELFAEARKEESRWIVFRDGEANEFSRILKIDYNETIHTRKKQCKKMER